jgi:hypothetical protein
MVGNPASWLEGTQQYANGIRLIRDLATQNRDEARAILQSGDVTAGGPAASPTQRLKQKYGLE